MLGHGKGGVASKSLSKTIKSNHVATVDPTPTDTERKVRQRTGPAAGWARPAGERVNVGCADVIPPEGRRGGKPGGAGRARGRRKRGSAIGRAGGQGRGCFRWEARRDFGSLGFHRPGRAAWTRGSNTTGRTLATTTHTGRHEESGSVKKIRTCLTGQNTTQDETRFRRAPCLRQEQQHNLPV